jgi:hypothetical protein
VRGEGESKNVKEAQSIRFVLKAKWFKRREVLRHAQSLDVVLADHREHHDGHNVAEPRLSSKYVINNLREKVNAVDGNKCQVCATHEPVKKKPITPICTTRKAQLVMFDLTKFYCPVRLPLLLFFEHKQCQHMTCAKPYNHRNMFIFFVFDSVYRTARGTHGY